MPYLRSFQHFRAKKHVHQEMVKPTIANFFAIVLQYNSNFIIVLQQYSKKYIYILLHRPFLSPLNSLFSFFSLFFLCSLLSSLFRPKHHLFFSSFSVGSDVWVVGHGSWLGCGSGVWVFGDGVGPMFGSGRWSWFYFLFFGL